MTNRTVDGLRVVGYCIDDKYYHDGNCVAHALDGHGDVHRDEFVTEEDIREMDDVPFCETCNRELN